MAGPVVPDAPGVPPLVRDEAPPDQPELETQDAISPVGQTSTPTWGLYKDGEPVLFADSVVALEFRQDWELQDYPIEDGAFETYNKVKTPFTIRVRFASGGSENNRGALLSDVAFLAETLDLYDVVTPEVTYLNCNIEHYDYRRTSDQGVGLLVVEVHLRQIRVVEQPAFSNTQPQSADAAFVGAVQAAAASSQQITDIAAPFNAGQAPTVGSVVADSPVGESPALGTFTQPSFPGTAISLFPQNGAGF